MQRSGQDILVKGGTFKMDESQSSEYVCACVCLCVYECVIVFVKGRNLELTCDVLRWVFSASLVYSMLFSVRKSQQNGKSTCVTI